MSKVVLNEVDELNAVLSITIEKKDYLARLNSQLEKYRKEAHMKGFRKGKTPMSVVQKMYGKSLLGDIINEKISLELQDFLESGAVEVAAYPIPVEDHPNFDFDAKSLDDYTFDFSIGKLVMPELKGFSAEDIYEEFKVLPSDEDVSQQWVEIQKSAATQVDKTGSIEAGDKITLMIPDLIPQEEDLEEVLEAEDVEKATDLEAEDTAGEEDYELLEAEEENDHEDEDEDYDDYEEEDDDEEEAIDSFSILVNDIYDEDLKQEFLSKSLGDTLIIDLRLLENQDDDYIKKYYLYNKEEHVAANYEVKIVGISSRVVPELNQELFDKVFGEGEVQSKEEADAKIVEDFKKALQSQSDVLLIDAVRKALLEKNNFPLPEPFLKRWLKVNNEGISDAKLEREFPDFLESLRWSHIKGKLFKDAGIEITREEILEVLRKQIRSYFGGGLPQGMESFVNNYAEQMMEKEESLRPAVNQVENEKFLYLIRSNVNLKETHLGFEEFKEKIQAFNEAYSNEEEEE